ncbi:MAG: hypothetical protein J4A00_10500, partial [Gammaproteobacteria bacterium]|nr:hypothetical protein [Gammaproteobacteria bacterium]
LSNWMTYEDGPRVAQLKTRADRFEKIRKDYGIKPDQKFEVTDFLVPDAPQIYGMLPRGLAQTVRKLGHRITPNFDKLKRETRMKTSAPFGYWSMRMVAWMRRLRPGSYRHQEEMDLIKRWEEAISHWSEKDPALGFLAAESARVTKGYGRVRETALDDFWSFLDEGLKELEQLGQRGGDMAGIGDAALKILASEAGKGPETLEFLRNYNLEAAA